MTIQRKVFNKNHSTESYIGHYDQVHVQKRIVLILFVGIQGADLSSVYAQDVSYARSVINTLTSPKYWGRGYTKNGMKKAALYIRTEFQKAGVQPFGVDSGQGRDYFQTYTQDVNTFPSAMSVSINGKKLNPGEDYIIFKNSRSADTIIDLTQQADAQNFASADQSVRVRIVPKKVPWSVSATKVENYTEVILFQDHFAEIPQTMQIHVANVFVKNFEAHNVLGIVPGTGRDANGDAACTIFNTAHYDHIGGMGDKTYFPGANDNAAGTALVLDLARHYAKNPHKCDMVFALFGSEEAGLIGSKFFVEHPLMDLSKITFLMNLDLVGTGQESIVLVNGTALPDIAKTIQDLNAAEKYFPVVTLRDNAPNSDHYWFVQYGVPALFLYQGGSPGFYHDIYDKAQTLLLPKYDELFHLLNGLYDSIAVSH